MRNIFTAAVAATVMLSAGAYASPERGLEIAKAAEATNLGWGDTESLARMVLRNKAGKESVRQMRIKSLEVQEDGDKGIVIFDEPKDIRGTALLTHSHKVGDDDQWLYLPAVKRVKRIASRNKSGPFMGSEFSYEDLSSQEIEKYTYNLVREDEMNGEKIYVLERFPVDKNSGYTRQVTYLDQAEYRIYKVEYYDRKKSHLKTLVMSDYKKYLDKYWRPHQLDMVNHQTGKSTTMSWEKIDFQTGAKDGDFTEAALRRMR
jgi:hypothetical protein